MILDHCLPFTLPMRRESNSLPFSTLKIPPQPRESLSAFSKILFGTIEFDHAVKRVSWVKERENAIFAMMKSKAKIERLLYPCG